MTASFLCDSVFYSADQPWMSEGRGWLWMRHCCTLSSAVTATAPYTYTHTHAHTHTRTCMCTHRSDCPSSFWLTGGASVVDKEICLQACSRYVTHTHTQSHTYTHIHTHIHIHTHSHTHTHIHTHAYWVRGCLVLSCVGIWDGVSVNLFL